MNRIKIKIIHGDALSELSKLNPDSVDFIFADPPYFLSNDGFTVQSGKVASVNKGKWDKSMGLSEDMKFHETWISMCREILRQDGTLAISGTYHSIFKCGYLLQTQGFRIINDIVWFKPNGSPSLAGRNFTASHETIIWASKSSKSKHFFDYSLSRNWNYEKDKLYTKGKQMRSVWSIPTTPKSEKSYGRHPTQKPLELMKRLVLLCSEKGDVVLDPFCGSGTTGVACKLTGRNFIGIESQPEFVELSKIRIREA